MKIFALSCILFLCFFSEAQNSYDFKVTLPPSYKPLTTVDQKHFGIYKASENGTYYEFNETGVWAISISYSSISREMIRESTTYSVRNGYLFGVVEGDSLPCELEGERYYFGVLNKQQIICGTSKNQLMVAEKNSFIINFYENGFYTPSFFEFSNKGLKVYHFDYDSDSPVFDIIVERENVTEGKLTVIHLSPNLMEWKRLDKDLMRTSGVEYEKGTAF
jgi:hypothetical protein